MKMKPIGVYKITNIITGDYYIGSSDNIEKRFLAHRYRLINNTHINCHLQHAWNKWGKQAFEFKVLLLCAAERKLSIEQGLLDLFKPAYNIATCAIASMQGLHHTEEARHKMSEWQIGRQLSEEHKHNISEGGKTRAPISEETRAKMSVARQGTHLSDETCMKMSESAKGNTTWIGRKHTEETRAKMSIAQKRRRGLICE